MKESKFCIYEVVGEKKKILGTYNVGSYVQLFICILFYSILINTIVL